MDRQSTTCIPDVAVATGLTTMRLCSSPLLKGRLVADARSAMAMAIGLVMWIAQG